MLRFYTPADYKKSLVNLYRIESIEDYIVSISKLNISIDELKNVHVVHSDYEFIESYISKAIEKSSRVVFLGVYDLSKEIYFVNKYPQKNFVIGDVSDKAISRLAPHFPNIEIVQTTYSEFEDKSGDLIVINAAEYFMNQTQLFELINKGENIIINNAHLYLSGWQWYIFSTFHNLRALFLNVLSFLVDIRQWQFRGWLRTVNDFTNAAIGSNKDLRCMFLNKKTETRLGTLYRCAIFYEK
uniref:hypothetical protein n=1 Tax=Polynucleobacter sp. TaxID=2029855 RepID=UPI0040471AB1